jgi:diguanylate cyclase (GGDEF)-like protein
MQDMPRILLVEERETRGTRLVEVLGGAGHEVVWKKDVVEGAAFLAVNEFDICILCATQEDALEFLQVVLYVGSDSPVLMLLPGEEPEMVEKCLGLGAIDTLEQDAGSEILIRAVRYAIVRHSAVWRQELSIMRDKLTGLPNFPAFGRWLASALEDASKVKNYEVGVMHLGLDGFTVVNSGLGHSAGDKLLVEISQRISECLRDRDMVARRGGDEFSILLTGPGVHESINIVVRRILKIFDTPCLIDGQEVFSSASIGISLSLGKDDPGDLIRDADIALQKAKKRGRGRFEIFLRTMERDAKERLQLETDLRRALVQRDFRLYYQPVMSLETGKVAYFEALMRWQHRERGLIPPNVFLDLAEETGLIVPMGWQLLHQACHQIAEWGHEGYKASISFNLSAEQFSTPELLGQLSFGLEVSGIDPKQLKLEITEGSLIENQDHAAELLEDIKRAGLEVYLDDFGTGYSSLAYLERFPLHGFKIDRAFVMKVITSDRRSAILQKIIDLGKILEMAVVAEGVETSEELAALEEMGCDMVQGYYYSRPMPAEEVASFMDKHS